MVDELNFAADNTLGVWIVANVLLVFGLETAARGFQRKRFAPRGRWNTPICWSIVGVMFIFTWIPSKVRPPKRDKCLASLIWWAAPWSHLAILLNSITIVVYVGTALAIGLQLFRSVKIRREDRIAASRMVYYLGIGIVLMVSEEILGLNSSLTNSSLSFYHSGLTS